MDFRTSVNSLNCIQNSVCMCIHACVRREDLWLYQVRITAFSKTEFSGKAAHCWLQHAQQQRLWIALQTQQAFWNAEPQYSDNPNRPEVPPTRPNARLGKKFTIPSNQQISTFGLLTREHQESKIAFHLKKIGGGVETWWGNPWDQGPSSIHELAITFPESILF